MFGDGEAEPSKDHAVLLCWEACKVGLPLVLAHKLNLLDFETRKDAAQVTFIFHTRLHSKLMYSLIDHQVNCGNTYSSFFCCPSQQIQARTFICAQLC